MQVQEELKNFLFENGVADVGFTCVDDGPFGETSYAMSIVVKLSDAVIDEITDEPTHSYFHHYRTVNAFIDRTLLQCGFILEKHGYKYIPIGASQSVNKGGWNYCGRYSHKKNRYAFGARRNRKKLPFSSQQIRSEGSSRYSFHRLPV